jgi:multidrug efflux system membrane fusion protein
MSEPQTGETPISNPILRAPPPRRRPLWKTIAWIVGVIGVAILVAWLLTPHGGGSGAAGPGGHGGARGGGPGGRRPPTVVGVATAALGDIPIQINALGAVTPQASVTVHTRIAGTLMSVNFTEGQMVRAGQLLALVDPRPYTVALEQAQGQLLRDQAALDEAKLDLARYTTLAAQDSIARQQVDTQAATVKQDQGVVKSDQAAVDSAKLNLVYCHITAPVSGRVGLRQVDPGNFVQTGDTNGVVVINEVDPITVIFSVPEDDIPQIQSRMMANKTLPVTAFDRTGAITLGQGELLTLDNQIDSTTGTVKARARFANPNGALFPSQFVNVTVLADTLRKAVTIPAVAIRHGPKGDFVYVVQLDSTVKVTPVKVGPAQGETASIASGLSVGDQVVTDGGDRLSDGATVVLPQDAAAMAARMNRKPKAGGILGWIDGLFGKKTDSAPGAASGADASPSSASDSSVGGAGGGGGGRHGEGGRMMAMIGQLDLTPDQKAKAQQIFANARAAAMASDDPNARRAAMQGAMTQLEAILTPAQKAKLAQLRAQAASGGGSSAPPASPPSSQGPSSQSPPDGASPATPSPPPTPPAATGDTNGHGGGGPGGPGGRMAMLTDQLGLDAGQQAKAQTIFAAARAKAEASDDPDARRSAMQGAMAQLSAILRPDQQAKLAAIRAARAGGGGGGQ